MKQNDNTPTIIYFEGDGLKENGKAMKKKEEFDEEFDYVFEGLKRDEDFHKEIFVPVEMPKHLVSNVKTRLVSNVVEECEEEEEEEEEEEDLSPDCTEFEEDEKEKSFREGKSNKFIENKTEILTEADGHIVRNTISEAINSGLFGNSIQAQATTFFGQNPTFMSVEGQSTINPVSPIPYNISNNFVPVSKHDNTIGFDDDFPFSNIPSHFTPEIPHPPQTFDTKPYISSSNITNPKSSVVSSTVILNSNYFPPMDALPAVPPDVADNFSPNLHSFNNPIVNPNEVVKNTLLANFFAIGSNSSTPTLKDVGTSVAQALSPDATEASWISDRMRKYLDESKALSLSAHGDALPLPVTTSISPDNNPEASFLNSPPLSLAGVVLSKEKRTAAALQDMASGTNSMTRIGDANQGRGLLIPIFNDRSPHFSGRSEMLGDSINETSTKDDVTNEKMVDNNSKKGVNIDSFALKKDLDNLLPSSIVATETAASTRPSPFFKSYSNVSGSDTFGNVSYADMSYNNHKEFYEGDGQESKASSMDEKEILQGQADDFMAFNSDSCDCPHLDVDLNENEEPEIAPLPSSSASPLICNDAAFDVSDLKGAQSMDSVSGNVGMSNVGMSNVGVSNIGISNIGISNVNNNSIANSAPSVSSLSPCPLKEEEEGGTQGGVGPMPLRSVSSLLRIGGGQSPRYNQQTLGNNGHANGLSVSSAPSQETLPSLQLLQSLNSGNRISPSDCNCSGVLNVNCPPNAIFHAKQPIGFSYPYNGGASAMSTPPPTFKIVLLLQQGPLSYHPRFSSSEAVLDPSQIQEGE